MRFRDLLEEFQTRYVSARDSALRGLPTGQEDMDAAAREHQVDIKPPEAPPDAAFKELHGTPWVPPAYE